MSAPAPRRVLVVFAKRPEPGAVKTRLCPPFEAEQAARLYAAMLDDVLEATAAAARLCGASTWLCAHPPDALEELAARCPGRWRVWPQRGADLGARMEAALADAADAGFDRILLRGSDNPALPVAALCEAFDALERADLVVGPDRDGGYGWIALRGPAPGLFDHAMSTSRVLDDTLARAEARGLGVRRMPPHFDVDRAEDLGRLAEARRAGRAGACPRTLGLLDREDLWRLA